MVLNNNFLQKKRNYLKNGKYQYNYYLLYKFEINSLYKQILHKVKINSKKFHKIKNLLNEINLYNCVSTLSNTQFIIFGKSNCEYCSMAVKLLINENKNYCYVNMNVLHNKKINSIKKFIEYSTNNYKYIPVIFYNGIFIGGYSELKIFLTRYNKLNLSYKKNDFKII